MVLSNYSIVAVTTVKLNTPIIIQRETARTRGLMPTDFIIFGDKLAPIKNSVNTRVRFATNTIPPDTLSGNPQ